MGLDLLSWPELEAAKAALASAHARQVEARRRVRCAPHGEIQSRLSALQEAVRASLKAELDLARLQAGA